MVITKTKMKTALSELIDFIEPELKMHDFLQLPAYEKAKTLLDTEKQQIIKAYDNAFNYVVGGGFVSKTGEQYFEEIYNNKK